MPLLRDYIAEHERVLNCGGEAIRALDRGDLAAAGDLLATMAQQLRTHWAGEEGGLFAVMAGDELFAAHIRPLVREHRELDALLASVDLTDAADQARIRAAVEELYEHIAKEEDGLFPASLTTLDGGQWDAAIAGWRRAHPGQELLR